MVAARQKAKKERQEKKELLRADKRTKLVGIEKLADIEDAMAREDVANTLDANHPAGSQAEVRTSGREKTTRAVAPVKAQG